MHKTLSTAQARTCRDCRSLAAELSCPYRWAVLDTSIAIASAVSTFGLHWTSCVLQLQHICSQNYHARPAASTSGVVCLSSNQLLHGCSHGTMVCLWLCRSCPQLASTFLGLLKNRLWFTCQKGLPGSGFLDCFRQT